MLLKRLLFSLLLGAFSVTALPNPEAGDSGLEARDNADELVARGYCPKGTVERYGECVCKNPKEEYNKQKGKCQPKCGEGAYRKHDQCVCKNPKEEYNKQKGKCTCTYGKKCGGYKFGGN
ncbi:hypothetical protein FOYG_17121 [Fusarium oxysporum NRRL 32931]|uniref:Uncharacterized protein n=1 Tax=Fusarium oxysporum NRRL 32931 TaxID=660029 RepID=W9HHQ2_FUSOX|nr:hypothetical protein FOYG_17121 [Fusarium oxysporum NRRL 32931]